MLCASLLTSAASTQKVKLPSSIHQAFITSDSTAKTPAFYLIRASPKTALKYQGVNVIRKLDSDHLIIQSDLSREILQGAFTMVWPTNDLWKLSPPLLRQWERKIKGRQAYLIKVGDLDLFKKLLLQKNIPLSLIRKTDQQTQSLLLYSDQKTVKQNILPSHLVQFVDLHASPPLEERGIQGLDLSPNNISTVHRLYPRLDGSPLTVSIKENSFDPQDIDLRNREIPSDLKDKLITTHATTMATLIGGAGNSFHNGKGVATNVQFSASSFSNLMPDEDAYFNNNQITTQNHSYGLPIENYYGLEAMAYDEQVHRLPHLLHVFSSGNNGEGTSEDGPYKDISGYANLTGNMKMAKNLLTVGSLDSLFRVPAPSSKGPAFDGRIKPELVAFGEDGSSGAAALTSGSIVLLQQAYQEQYGQLAPASLIRALLLNAADDIGDPGPDYTSGYGKLDLLGAIEAVEEEHFFLDTISIQSGSVKTFPLQIPSQAMDLKITLAWSDPAATLNSDIALVNDLDLEVEGEQTGISFLPWILNTTPNIDSLASPAKRGQDRLNNQEQITISLPTDSSFVLKVRTDNLPVDHQAFSIVYEYKLPEQFRWLFPRSTDHFPGGGKKRLIWETTFQQSGQLSYKLVESNEWINISDNVVLGEIPALWSIPDTLAQIQLRMAIGEREFLSDTITISNTPVLSLELTCEESSILTWNKIPRAIGYQLYAMQTRFLDPILAPTDTFAILEKSNYPYTEYAVAAVLPNGNIATKSRSINLNFQSAGCYISNFLADLIEDRVEMQLALGSLYELKEIQFQKYDQGQFRTLANFTSPTELLYKTEDLNLREGANIYRVVVFLQDGTSIISDEISLLYTSKDFLVFPNPTHPLEGISIIAKDTEGVQILLFDNLGRLIVQQDVLSPFEQVLTDQFTPGIYHYMILQDNNRRAEGKIVVH